MISDAFYFGQNKTCFGHFTPAASFSVGKSILIVPSIFGEAIRSHRVIREATKKLSAQGYDVLRFDYDGDGNSSSETKDVLVQHWLQNIHDAYDELSKRSVNSTVSVMAVRFGAGLSLIALKSKAIESYVLWDPIISRKEMYKIFVGDSLKLDFSKNEQETYNLFEQESLPDGFFEIGLDQDFAQGFIDLTAVILPSCKVDIIESDKSKLANNTQSNLSVCSVSHECDWRKKDLPVIFAPKLISTICEFY